MTDRHSRSMKPGETWETDGAVVTVLGVSHGRVRLLVKFVPPRAISDNHPLDSPRQSKDNRPQDGAEPKPP